MILHNYHIVHNIKVMFKSRYIYRTHIYISQMIFKKIGMYRHIFFINYKLFHILQNMIIVYDLHDSRDLMISNL